MRHRAKVERPLNNEPIRQTWSVTAPIRRRRNGPQSARLAVQFVINYEEGGENNIPPVIRHRKRFRKSLPNRGSANAI